MRIAHAVMLGLATLTGCSVAVPTGPSVAVMPAQGKPFEVFANDNAVCMQYAHTQVGVGPQQAGQTEMVASAATGAVVGAAAGAVLGDSSHDAGAGAGAGLLVGTAVGADSAYRSSSELQRRYDIAYMQCMYAKGNQLPHQASPYSGGQRYRYRVMPPPPPPY